MKFAFSTIKTNDLVSSLKFYEDIIGLVEIRRINPQEGVQCVFLKDEDNSIIELVETMEPLISSKEHTETQMALGFSVDDLDKALEMLKKNDIQIIRGPFDAPGGVKIAFIEDPNGVSVELIEGFI